MKISLAENIRAHRKKFSLTQEQLADAMGVSVGAVSKWESGQSTPEVAMIMELAAFFETSVDVLLGYQHHRNSVEAAVEQLKKYRTEHDYATGLQEAEKLLQKYPNNFQVVYACAMLYHSAMSRDTAHRALELMRRACQLIDQNTDESISVFTIRNYMAETYLFVLNQPEECIKLLKQNNFGGLNNGFLGYTMVTHCNDVENGLPYLSEALLDSIMALYRTAVGLSSAYSQMGDLQKAKEILLWLINTHAGLKDPDQVMFLDKADLLLYTDCAKLAVAQDRPEEARELLRSAFQMAFRFDKNPVYDMTGFKYYHGTKCATAHDPFGESAVKCVTDQLRIDKEGCKLLPVWEEIQRTTTG